MLYYILQFPVFQENLDVYLGLNQFVIDSSEGNCSTSIDWAFYSHNDNITLL